MKSLRLDFQHFEVVYGLIFLRLGWVVNVYVKHAMGWGISHGELYFEIIIIECPWEAYMHIVVDLRDHILRVARVEALFDIIGLICALNVIIIVMMPVRGLT